MGIPIADGHADHVVRVELLKRILSLVKRAELCNFLDDFLYRTRKLVTRIECQHGAHVLKGQIDTRLKHIKAANGQAIGILRKLKIGHGQAHLSRNAQTKILIQDQMRMVVVIGFDDPVVKNQGAFVMCWRVCVRAFCQKFGETA